ncbi:MAG: glycosyltransferase family 4 protein [Janthinobacterium lividum]
MRLLLTTDAVGGVWRYSLELAAGLGWDVVLAVVGPAPSLSQRAETPGMRVVETGLPLDWAEPGAASLQRSAEVLAELAGREGVGAVQLHAPALVGEAAWPVPVVAVAHSDVATWWAAMRQGPVAAEFAGNVAATAAGLARADAAVAPSVAMAEALRRVHGCGPVAVVRNGRRPLPPGRGPRRPGVLTVGRLWDEAKGAGVLDAAAGGLGAPVRAAGAVRGPHGAAFRPEHLQVLGVLDEAGLAEAMAGASVFASAARYEPFGLSVLEAAQAGMALVLSDIPSFRELWDGAALFVAPGDAGGFAEAMRRALGAPEGLAAAAGERAGRYGVAQMAAGMAAVHMRAGGRGRPEALPLDSAQGSP